jgi:hypothetical protein
MEKFVIENAVKITFQNAGKLILDSFEINIPKTHSHLKLNKIIKSEKFDFDFKPQEIKNEELKLIPLVNRTTMDIKSLNDVAISWHEFNKKLNDEKNENVYIWWVCAIISILVLIVVIVAATFGYLKYKKNNDNQNENQIENQIVNNNERPDENPQGLERAPMQRVVIPRRRIYRCGERRHIFRR